MKRKEREWMYKRQDKDHKLQDEFIKGVDKLVTFSQQHPELNDRDKIRCPCVRCKLELVGCAQRKGTFV